MERIPTKTTRLCSFAYAADICGCSRDTIKRWVDAGILSVVQLPNGMKRVDCAELEDLMQAKRVHQRQPQVASCERS